MKLSTHAAVEIPRPRDQVFEYLTDAAAFADYLLSHGLIAGIASAEMLDHAPMAIDARRRVHMTDGSIIDETICEYDPPLEHGYRWTGTLKPPFSLLVRSGHGHWTFSETTTGTLVDWRYTFEIKSPLLWPLVRPILVMFRGWQRAGLTRARARFLGQEGSGE